MPPLKVYDNMPRASYTGPLMPRPADTPSFTDNIKQGFSFGIGSSLAHRLVNNIFGSSQTKEQSTLQTPIVPTSKTENTSLDNQLAYQQCLKDNGDHDKCKDYLI